MSGDTNSFVKVEYQKEIDKVFFELESSVRTVAMEFEDGQQFMCRLRHVIDSLLSVEPMMPVTRKLSEGDKLRVYFGLSEGWYMVPVTFSSHDKPKLFFKITREAFKLQRRNNFRTVIPADANVEFSPRAMANLKRSSLRLYDLSVSGMRTEWTLSDEPKRESEFDGELKLPGGKSVDLVARIKTVQKRADGKFEVGFEFLNVPMDDQQMLLMACVQLKRSTLKGL